MVDVEGECDEGEEEEDEELCVDVDDDGEGGLEELDGEVFVLEEVVLEGDSSEDGLLELGEDDED